MVSRLAVESSECQYCIQTAEGKRVGEGDIALWVHGSRLLNDDVEVEWGVDCADTSGIRQTIGFERQNGCQRLDRSGSADGVAGLRFRRSHRNPGREFAQRLVDRGRFYRIVGLRAGTVGVDVPDPAGKFIDARFNGIFNCPAHGQRGTFSSRLGDVVCVGRHAEADYLCVDVGASRLRRFEWFEDEHGSAFA